MPIYEAAFLGEPQPVTKKGKGKAKAKLEQPPPAPVPAPAAPVDAPADKPKPKRVVKRKQPEPETPVTATVPVEAPVPTPTPPAPKKTKKQTKQATQEMTPSESSAEEAKPQKPIRKSTPKPKLTIVDGEPTTDAPGWFKAWCADEAKRRNSKKPKAEKTPVAQVIQKAHSDANEQWADKQTRQKVVRMQGSQERLYSQIFSR